MAIYTRELSIKKRVQIVPEKMDNLEQVFENKCSDTNWYNGKHAKEMEMGQKWLEHGEVVRCGIRRSRSAEEEKQFTTKEQRRFTQACCQRNRG